MAYDRGDSVRSQATFAVNSVATDPTTVKFKLLSPTGAVTTYTYLIDLQIIRSAAGVYYVDFNVDTPGKWATRWEGTGACAAADETSLQVEQGVFG